MLLRSPRLMYRVCSLLSRWPLGRRLLNLPTVRVMPALRTRESFVKPFLSVCSSTTFVSLVTPAVSAAKVPQLLMPSRGSRLRLVRRRRRPAPRSAWSKHLRRRSLWLRSKRQSFRSAVGTMSKAGLLTLPTASSRVSNTLPTRHCLPQPRAQECGLLASAPKRQQSVILRGKLRTTTPVRVRKSPVRLLRKRKQIGQCRSLYPL